MSQPLTAPLACTAMMYNAALGLPDTISLLHHLLCPVPWWENPHMVLLQGQPGAAPFDFDESKIFHKFDLFTKRCKKLISMFTTIHQFSSLAQYTHLDGLDQMIKNFYNIVDDIKRKPYDLLDFYKTQFDRDFLEFNVNIHDLELALQAFINTSFQHISSTEHALNLLRQFQAILVRDSLKVTSPVCAPC